MRYELEARKDKAKRVPIEDILAHFGFHPKKGRHYISPFRPQEREPSFSIDTTRNTWSDFGDIPGHSSDKDGRREDGITFVMWYEHLDFMEALAVVESIGGIVPSDDGGGRRTVIAADDRDVNQIKVVSVGPLERKELTDYIASRGIPLDIARRYCCQVSYSCGPYGVDVPFYGIGIPNDAGGYAIRTAPYGKHTRGRKTCSTQHVPFHSTFRLEEGKVDPRCLVFEGLFNFLSWCCLFGYPSSDVVVLNSAKNASELDGIADSGVEALHCFLDNDKEGRDALEHLSQHSGCNVYDCSNFYANLGINDLNDYLLSTAGR